MDNGFRLSKETRDQMISAIKEHFSVERDEEIGDLAASLILDFFIAKMAPAFYNQGVYDSFVFLNRRIEDLLGIQKPTAGR